MEWKRAVSSLSLAAFAMLPLGLPVVMQAQSGPYSVIDHWKVSGAGAWDYALADPSRHVLYVTHGDQVQVLDLNDGKQVGAITGLKRTHGVVLDPDSDHGYISDGDANAVVVFDRKSYEKIKSIPAGMNPDGMVYEPVTKTVWAFNGHSNSVTVIDTADMTVAETIQLPGKPEFPVADGKGMVYDNLETKNAVIALDAKTRKQTALWPLGKCEEPSGLAIDTAHRRLFSVCDGTMAITDANSGKVLKQVKIGDGPDATRFDPKYDVAFSPNGDDGTLTVVNTKDNQFNVLQTLQTKKSGRTMALDPETGRVFVIVAQFGPLPAPTAAKPHPRPSALPGTFEVLVIGRK